MAIRRSTRNSKLPSSSPDKKTNKNKKVHEEDEDHKLEKRKKKKKKNEETEEEKTRVVKNEMLQIHPTSFSWLDAQRHLSIADHQLAHLFGRLPCRPFDQLLHLDSPKPDAFRNLSTSIISQQVSCQAARSITYRFIRLFHPHLPAEIKPTNKIAEYPFPTPLEVMKATEIELKSAGLSTRKISYVKDLAIRFQDGRLDTDSLLKMDQEALMSALLEVRGIGRWTVQMFQIFCTRNPDVLPHTDLAIQKGVIKWYTTCLDPSIYNTEAAIKTELVPLTSPPLIPSGSPLSKMDLARRLHKPLKPGLYLSQIEMEQLTNHWRPYRSIPVCYIWAMTGFIPESL